MFCKIVLPSSEIHKLPSVPKTFDELTQLCQKKYSGKLPQNPTYKYKDSDEELITLLNDEDLETAILTHEQEKIKTLRLFIVEGEAPKQSSEIQKQPSQSFPIQSERLRTNNVYFQEKPAGNQNFKKPATYSYNQDEDDELNRLAGELNTLGQLKRSVSHTSAYEYDEYQQSKQRPKSEGFTEEQFKRIEAYIEKLIKERVDLKLNPVAQELMNKAIEEEKRKADDAFNVNTMLRTSVKKKPGMMSASMNPMRTSMKKTTDSNRPYYCDGCSKKIDGVRYTCTECKDFDFCEKCEETKEHPHNFKKIKPEAPSMPVQAESDFLSKIPRVGPATSISNHPTPKPSIKKFSAKIVREPIYDVIRVKQRKAYNIVFTIKNSGEMKWPDGVKLLCVGGIHQGLDEDIGSLDQGLEKNVNLSLQAPEDVGKFASHWRLHYFEDQNPQPFGANLFFEVHVIEDRERGDKDDDENLASLTELEIKMMREMKCTAKVMASAKALHDFLPEQSTFKDKVEFIKQVPSSLSINDIIDQYLQHIEKTQRRPSISKPK